MNRVYARDVYDSSCRWHMPNMQRVITHIYNDNQAFPWSIESVDDLP